MGRRAAGGNGRIAEFGIAGDICFPAAPKRVDACRYFVGPGFVDIMCIGGNGAGFDTNPATPCEYFLSQGETTVLPTLYYDLTAEEMIQAIGRIRAVKNGCEAGKAIGGIYMEGPYMNPKYGASPEKNKWRGDICEEDYRKVVDRGGDFIKVWAIAPERAGLVPFLQYAKKVNPNVVFSVGHSEAAANEIRSIRKYGVTLQTHCMNATGRNIKFAGTRAAGPDEYCLSADDMFAELICDSCGIHVCPELLRMVLKIKGQGKVILITDSFVGSQKAPKEFQHIRDLNFDANGGLCGSNLTMAVACRNVMAHTNCGIAQAFILASLNPAKALGLDSEIGSIEKGKKANLVFVDDMFTVGQVIFEGRVWH